MSLKSSFEQEQRLLREKISDIESKLTNKQNEIKSLENKIHMLLQSEGSQKNELNFWNGKVVTLKRDLDFQ
jgi:flagellar basal body rod protein FlgG